ncbi:hypothetical protein DB41_KK00140 [Neochlamydia sp. TUME1]|uniref:hypothetical protein n=1 Tax=Neochlamydia sp. TUME1 TaxID=1478174 RepID=UPI0005827DB5|nr:hypothetical protein [Neochlamydia sp. TUME1]KIC72488.1 hypothetical protein DB41_KK00140 [Neochlamydia sp. TUME1]
MPLRNFFIINSNMPDKNHYLFLTAFFIATLIALISIVSFNYLIDPFDYFKPPIIVGFNDKKLESTQERFDKAAKIIVKKPTAIMLGSSRVRAGFPITYYTQLAGGQAYKAAFSGARFDEIFGYFEHALYNQPDLKAVFLSLDFFAFASQLEPVAEYREDRLRRASLSFSDWAQCLLSQQTIKFSWSTFKHNINPKKLEEVAGYYVKIDENDFILLNPIIVENPVQFLKEEKRLIFNNYEIDDKKVTMFRKLVQRCQENNIDLKVVFSPAHVYYWEALYQCNCWKALENLKRQLSAIYPIYDFSGFCAFNQEDLSVGNSNRHFFEVSHFTPLYGQIILDRVYGKENGCQEQEAGFLLNPQTVELHLTKIRKQRDDWIEKNFDLVIWLQNQLNI